MDLTVAVKILCLIIVAFFGLVASQPSGQESNQLDLVKSLFQVKNYDNIGHYSGYLEAGDRTFLHYWFFRARAPNWKNYPLIVWFHGGPGSSSVSAGLSKFGAIRLRDDLTLDIGQTLSYINRANVLYFDTPAGVGFSYQLDPKDKDFNAAHTANYNYAAIKNFFFKFHFLKNNDFYLIGSNNASISVSLLGIKLVENKFLPNFKGVLYVSSIFNETVRNFATLAHGNKLGLFDESLWARFVETCCPANFSSVRECYHENCLYSNSPCSYTCKILLRHSNSDNIYKHRELSENETIYQNTKEAWFQSESTMKSLNIREFSNSKWKETNSTISSKFEDISVSSEVRVLLENEIPVTIVYGDSDLITSYYNGMWLLDNLGDKLKLQFHRPCYSDRKLACHKRRYIYTNMANRMTNVTFIVFIDAGHDFYYDQFDVFSDMIIDSIYSK